ncbi:MAG: hemolysin III family protein [Candidatus Hydrogenedentes bacterium]|nr:hemolysin III family protein [Candidatus Hydrogenedentota bacterium]
MSHDTVFACSRREEFANCATHFVGATLSILALWRMLAHPAAVSDAYRIVSVFAFGGSMILLYTASTLYHAMWRPTPKQIMRTCDHACIFLLIAGTYTPYTIVSLKGGWGWSLFGVVWGLAICGIAARVFLRAKSRLVMCLIYIGMGWLGAIAFKPALDVLPLAGFMWLIAGGFMYTMGVIFYAWRKLPYNHAIWHLFVMLGTLCHFLSIYLYVLPMPRA